MPVALVLFAAGSAADTSPRQVAVGGADPVAASASSHQLSGEEMGVLAATSRINGRVFVPFIADADAGERFCSSSPFSDPDGLLPLSQKQRQQLHEWRRPSQLYPEPCVIKVESVDANQPTVSFRSINIQLHTSPRHSQLLLSIDLYHFILVYFLESFSSNTLWRCCYFCWRNASKFYQIFDPISLS